MFGVGSEVGGEERDLGFYGLEGFDVGEVDGWERG